MEEAIGTLRYLPLEEVLGINRRAITETGGLASEQGALLNLNSLEYLIDIVRDDDYFPSIFDKAAAYAFNIITRHIFLDGNKRTGLICAFHFLRTNGRLFRSLPSDDEIVDVGIKIAEGKMDIERIASWLSSL